MSSWRRVTLLIERKLGNCMVLSLPCMYVCVEVTGNSVIRMMHGHLFIQIPAHKRDVKQQKILDLRTCCISSCSNYFYDTDILRLALCAGCSPTEAAAEQRRPGAGGGAAVAAAAAGRRLPRRSRRGHLQVKTPLKIAAILWTVYLLLAQSSASGHQRATQDVTGGLPVTL